MRGELLSGGVSAKVREPSGKIVLQLKISLRNTDPIVWRRVLVPGAMPLDKLHLVIQAAMGWLDRHLHTFEIYGKRYGVPEPDEWDEEDADLDEYGIRIHLLLDDDDHFIYEYDLGDNWVHDIEVESISEVDAPLLQAICLDGARACPPEDCGGTSGFADFVETMADVSHPERPRWLNGSEECSTPIISA